MPALLCRCTVRCGRSVCITQAVRCMFEMAVTAMVQYARRLRACPPHVRSQLGLFGITPSETFSLQCRCLGEATSSSQCAPAASSAAAAGFHSWALSADAGGAARQPSGRNGPSPCSLPRAVQLSLGQRSIHTSSSGAGGSAHLASPGKQVLSASLAHALFHT